MVGRTVSKNDRGNRIYLRIRLTKKQGDGPHKPLAFDKILVHLLLSFVLNLINKILLKPKKQKEPGFTSTGGTINKYARWVIIE